MCGAHAARAEAGGRPGPERAVVHKPRPEGVGHIAALDPRDDLSFGVTPGWAELQGFIGRLDALTMAERARLPAALQWQLQHLHARLRRQPQPPPAWALLEAWTRPTPNPAGATSLTSAARSPTMEAPPVAAVLQGVRQRTLEAVTPRSVHSFELARPRVAVVV